MENDDIQDFDLRWEQALLLTRDLPSDKVLEGLYVSKIQESSQAHTIMAHNNQKNQRGGGQRYDHRLRICVKLHIEQTQRSKNFRIQNEIKERGAVIKGKGQNPCTKRKTGERYHRKATGCCSEGESCIFLHKPALRNREVKVDSARGSGLKLANERVRKR